MRELNCTILGPIDDSVSQNGSQVDSNQLIAASFQAVFGDTSAAGTFVIQGSNDVAPLQYTSPTTFIVTNWTNIPNATATITGGASAMITIPTMCYRWVRAVYTSASGGTTTVTVNMMALSQ